MDRTEEGKFKPGDGAAYIKAFFRLIVFRPFVGEVIVGSISRSDSSGILVTLGFFDFVFIPASNLPVPSSYVAEDKVWKWDYGDSELYLDKDSDIRVQVTALIFNPINPTKPKPLPTVLAELQPAFLIQVYLIVTFCPLHICLSYQLLLYLYIYIYIIHVNTRQCIFCLG